MVDITKLTDEDFHELYCTVQEELERRKKESEKMKFYLFKGVWSFRCYAKNREEAKKKFDKATVDDMFIAVNGISTYEEDPDLENL